MKHRIIRTPAAKQDIWNIADGIAKENIDAAIRFLDAAEAAFSQLAEMPKMGERIHIHTIPNLRHWVISAFPNYTIFYIPTSTKSIEVIRVLHGARDIECVLEE